MLVAVAVVLPQLLRPLVAQVAAGRARQITEPQALPIPAEGAADALQEPAVQAVLAL